MSVYYETKIRLTTFSVYSKHQILFKPNMLNEELHNFKPQQTLLGRSNQGGCDRRGMWHKI